MAIIHIIEARTLFDTDIPQSGLQPALLYLQTGEATLQCLAKYLAEFEPIDLFAGNLETIPLLQPTNLLHLEIAGNELYDLIQASALLEVFRSDPGFRQLLNLQTVVLNFRKLEWLYSAYRRLIVSREKQINNLGAVRAETQREIDDLECQIRKSFATMTKRLAEFQAAASLATPSDTQNLLMDDQTTYSQTE